MPSLSRYTRGADNVFSLPGRGTRDDDYFAGGGLRGYARLEAQQFERAGKPEEFGKLVQSETDKWSKVVKSTGLPLIQ